MKKLILTISILFFSLQAFSQAPSKISYQAVIRDAGNDLVSNSPIGTQVSIIQGSTSGTTVYVETHADTTNENGLLSLQIGEGTVVSGSFSGIDWATGPYFIQTETDPLGGSNYTITSLSELMSVPYALHANTADSLIGGISITETDPVFGASLASGITAADTAKWNETFTAGEGIDITNNTISLTTTNVENLTIVQGTFNPAGNIISGAGYSVTKTATGEYSITFTNSFSSFPAMSYSTNFVNRLVLSNVITFGSATIVVRDTSGNLADPNAWISFTAIGPK